MRSIFKYVVVLCLVLTLWSAAAVVIHHHSKGTESARCTVCVAAHSAVPKAISGLLHATFVRISTLRTQSVSAKACVIAFALTVRPPPAA